MAITVKVAVHAVSLVMRRVDELETLGADIAVPLPQCGELHHDGLVDGPGLQHRLGRGGEPDGGVLQSDDVRLLDELLQVLAVHQLTLAGQGEHLEDGHHVT